MVRAVGRRSEWSGPNTSGPCGYYRMQSVRVVMTTCRRSELSGPNAGGLNGQDHMHAVRVSRTARRRPSAQTTHPNFDERTAAPGIRTTHLGAGPLIRVVGPHANGRRVMHPCGLTSHLVEPRVLIVGPLNVDGRTHASSCWTTRSCGHTTLLVGTTTILTLAVGSRTLVAEAVSRFRNASSVRDFSLASFHAHFLPLQSSGSDKIVLVYGPPA